MKNILIICGAEKAGYSEGRYNRSLADTARNTLSPSFNVSLTHISDGYKIESEQEKFKQADYVIYQFPVFWFNCPSTLKKYIDQVFTYGVFFERKVPYGTGGLMSGKHYLLSTTWNAPKAAFGDPAGFYQDSNVDDALISMHKANQYIGMQPLPSFTTFDVIKNPNYSDAEIRWTEHLKNTFLSAFDR